MKRNSKSLEVFIPETSVDRCGAAHEGNAHPFGWVREIPRGHGISPSKQIGAGRTTWFRGGYALGYLWLVILTGATVACGVAKERLYPQKPGTRRPNIVLISVDTLRADHLQMYDYERNTAPKLGLIASEGIVFENAFSQAPKTAPSHMTMLTGLYPESHGVKNLGEDENSALSHDVPTLAEILGSDGYSTGAVVAGGHVSSSLGFDRGFQYFAEEAWLETALDRAIEIVRDFANSDEPFFLFLHTYSVHDPYVPPPAYQIFNSEDYSGNIIGTRESLNELSGEQWSQQHDLYWQAVDPNSPEDVQRLKDLYDAAILHTDNLIGKFLAALMALGVFDDTVIVVLSDHGEEFQDHGGFQHETLYEEILRVPLIIRLPDSFGGAPRGVRIQNKTRLVDLLPSILELLNVPIPDSVQGKSFFSEAMMKGNEEREIFSQWPREEQFALQNGDWKLICSMPDSCDQLYDLQADPLETVNLLGSYPDQVTNLRQRLRTVLAESRKIAADAEAGWEAELGSDRQDQLKALGYLD